ncbi:UDP-N-acetylglucosamine 1-carboxyvinyltransferase, putative [Babesia ovata]|uniref:UDP-N-acetylglucosamine 1-carboxyvinyltransferase, putative n=1 Tax=Babesia ovata TaxID=189622 RepID=A0A2H6K6H3_9APIC|nr:UDP-N-acetylglucosamine 1-carboxyvinyltransferase, putative [Babesia ovata]GBE58597.1 UDP-N-acetylglucosamine 1-carboxyvinyltransferase, putative [Babesia ovata]
MHPYNLFVDIVTHRPVELHEGGGQVRDILGILDFFELFDVHAFFALQPRHQPLEANVLVVFDFLRQCVQLSTHPAGEAPQRLLDGGEIMLTRVPCELGDAGVKLLLDVRCEIFNRLLTPPVCFIEEIRGVIYCLMHRADEQHVEIIMDALQVYVNFIVADFL